MVSAIDRKLLRDLRRLSGQVITIAVVVACGIAAYVSTRTAYDSLRDSRTTYYERAYFADVFAQAKRAPESVGRRIERIDGVSMVDTRIVETASMPIEELPEPATARIISIPAPDQPRLNRLYLREGRMPRPSRENEALIIESFAEAHDVEPGETLPVVVNGTLRDVRVVGIALSPEYVFAMLGGEIAPDPARYAVLWMSQDVVAAAYDLEGAFNNVVLRMRGDVSDKAVLSEVDRILEPYGGLGAVTRAKQPSNFMLEGELQQLDVMATVIPAIFLGVAAFLLNVVLSRLVNLQRAQIAALKALGYADWQVGLHYLKLVSVIVVIGALIGVGLGAWLGRELTELYTQFFRFPVLAYRLDLEIVLVAVGVSLLASLVGAIATTRHVARLAPAEAMRPAPPAPYRKSVLDRIGLHKLFGQSSRMVLRELERRPLRLALSVLGISMAVAILVVGRFFYDSIGYLMDVHFQAAMREDLMVAFAAPVPERTERELAHLPGVLHAEGVRAVPVRFRSKHRKRDSVINGYPEDGTLRRLIDKDANDVPLPPDGIVLTRKLAEILELEAGDTVRVEVLEGNRGKHEVVVTGLADEMFGLQGHMRLESLNRMMRQERTVSAILLHVDPKHMDEVRSRLVERKGVTEVVRKTSIKENFEQQSGEMILAFTFILAVFAAAIAIGVVYNNARVALSMRSRDLASLRVLGFTRGEISSVLLGELAVQVLLAIPLGLVLGTWGSHLVSSTMDPETYRIPTIVSSRTYAFASIVTVGAALVSALLVRRKLDHLDLIGVLKTRE